jgi:hypothetical protein
MFRLLSDAIARIIDLGRARRNRIVRRRLCCELGHG